VRPNLAARRQSRNTDRQTSKGQWKKLASRTAGRCPPLSPTLWTPALET
jgi:hypothetical protein